MKNIRFAALFLCFMFSFMSLSPGLWAQVEEKIDTREKRDVVLYRGDLVTLQVYSLTRIAISTPGIVDIINADVDEILLVGKALGQTQIFIWDEYGKRSVLARVMEQDLDMVRERIEKLLEAAEIEGITLKNSSYEGKLIATGKVNKSQKEEFDEVIGDLSQYLINMVEEQQDLVQIDAQVVELNTTLQNVMGAQWSTSFTVNEQTYPVNQNGYFGDIFKIGDIERTELISATVSALLSTSKARTLSRPSLVVSDGEEASILVGGEIPIITSTTSDGAVTENVNYKTYGVDLSVTPTIKDNDKIDIVLNVNIRDLGTAYGDNTSFTTTTTQTKVLLDDGQTIILAGLIKKGETITEARVPFLGSIPIIGLFFRYKSRLNSPDQEVVISLTPHIRRQKNRLKTEREIKKKEEMERVAARQIKEKQKTKSFDFQDKTERIKKQDIESEKAALTAREESGEEDSILDEDLERRKESEEAAVDDAQFFLDEAEERGMNEKEEALNAEDFGVDEEAAGYVEEGDEVFFDDDMDALLAAVEKGAGGEDVFLDETMPASEITNYAKGVQEKIAKKISFPFQAKEEGWEGTVILSLTILSDGSLSDVEIKESSGYNIFDNDAVNTAEIVSPFAPFPVEMEMDEITVSVPVIYSQKAFLAK